MRGQSHGDKSNKDGGRFAAKPFFKDFLETG